MERPDEIICADWGLLFFSIFVFFTKKINNLFTTAPPPSPPPPKKKKRKKRKKKKKKKKYAAAQMAIILATRWTGNKLLLKGGPVVGPLPTLTPPTPPTPPQVARCRGSSKFAMIESVENER